MERICSSCFGKRLLLGSNEFEVRQFNFVGDKTDSPLQKLDIYVAVC